MTRLRSTARPAVLAAALGLAACGARVMPAPPVGAEADCEALLAIGPRPDHPSLEPVWAALDDGAWEDALAAGARVRATVAEQAVARFHGDGVDADGARDFFYEWVLDAPSVLVVDVDRFRFDASIGGPLVVAAIRAGDRRSARRWLAESAFDELAVGRARACIDRAGT